MLESKQQPTTIQSSHAPARNCVEQSPDVGLSSSKMLNAALDGPEDQKKALTEVKKQTRRHNQNARKDIATCSSARNPCYQDSLEYNQVMGAPADTKG